MVLKMGLIKRIKNTLSNWPPLIVFLVCLLLFSLTTFCLGIYIRHFRIINPHIKSWNGFLAEVSKMKFCTAPSGNYSILNNSSDANYEVLIRYLSDSSGFSPLANNKSLYMIRPPSANFYSVRVGAAQVKANETTVCLHVSGADALLPSVTAPFPPNCTAQPASLPPGGSVEFTAGMPLPQHCSGSVYALNFWPSPHWLPFMTDHDRMLVYNHLLTTSVFIAIFAAVLFVCVVVRNKSKTTQIEKFSLINNPRDP